MYCTNCGSKIADNSKFCSDCGAILADTGHKSEPVVPPPSPTNNRLLIKWYFQPAFISLWFAFSFFIIPAIVGIVLLVFYYRDMKKIKMKCLAIDDVEAYKCDTEQKCRDLTLKAITQKEDAEKNFQEIVQKIRLTEKNALDKQKSLEKETEKLRLEIAHLSDEIFDLDIDVFTEDKVTSEEYKDRLSVLKIKEKELIKNGTDVIRDSTMNKKIASANTKQILRCFNAESAKLIDSVTDKNISTMRGKLQRCFETLNKIFEVDGVEITLPLYQNKLEQMNTVYQYEVSKAREREEQKAIREQMLEEEKVRREIEKEKQKIEKEENQFKNEITKLMGYLQKADSIEKQLYVDKIQELEHKLKLLEKDKENVLQKEQNTRAGYVYIISNIGSFGEDVYKIGMTRRLEPMDRVKELGSASVPFEFDVHAMIFSEDAPALETVLHNTFRKQAVNRVNDRKEFFHVKLNEIEKVVKKNHNATVIFTKIAQAEQYRQTLKIIETEAVAVS